MVILVIYNFNSHSHYLQLKVLLPFDCLIDELCGLHYLFMCAKCIEVRCVGAFLELKTMFDILILFHIEMIESKLVVDALNSLDTKIILLRP